MPPLPAVVGGGKPESRSAHHNSGERSCSPPRRDVPGEGKGSGPLQSQLRGGQEGTCRAEGEGPQSLPSPPPSREAPSPQSPPQSRGASPSQSRGASPSQSRGGQNPNSMTPRELEIIKKYCDWHEPPHGEIRETLKKFGIYPKNIIEDSGTHSTNHYQPVPPKTVPPQRIPQRQLRLPAHFPQQPAPTEERARKLQLTSKQSPECKPKWAQEMPPLYQARPRSCGGEAAARSRTPMPRRKSSSNTGEGDTKEPQPKEAG